RTAFSRRAAHADHRDLHRLPARRSSDLLVSGREVCSSGESAPAAALSVGRFASEASRCRTSAVAVDAGKSDAALCCCGASTALRSEEHTSELQSRENLVCRLLPEKKNAE